MNKPIGWAATCFVSVLFSAKCLQKWALKRHSAGNSAYVSDGCKATFVDVARVEQSGAGPPFHCHTTARRTYSLLWFEALGFLLEYNTT